MILQYQGFGRNLVYVEVDSVAFCTIELPPIPQKASLGLDEIENYRKIANEKIEMETGVSRYSEMTTKALHELGYAKLVTWRTKEKEETYLFDVDNDVYLLNNEGKTVRRI